MTILFTEDVDGMDLKHIRLLAFYSRLKQTRLKKERYIIRQDNIQIFDKSIFFRYRMRQIKTTETNKKITYLN